MNPIDWKVREGHVKDFWPHKAKVLGVHAAFVASHPNSVQLTEIAHLIDSRKLKPIVERVLPLLEVRRAHELSEAGHTRGKIVLRVKE
jgi:NADPH:quinone reductase-like Zn-dependent oxidoreductase